MSTVSKLAQLICANMHVINGIYIRKYQEYFMKKALLYGEITGMLGQDNEFYPIPEMPTSTFALCSGMHIMDPDYSFDDNSFVVSAKVERKMWQSGAYCDSDQMLGESDPRRLYFDNDPGRQERVIKELYEHEHGIDVLTNAFDSSLRRVPRYRFLDHFWSGREFYGVAFHYFTNYAYMKSWCAQHYKEDIAEGSKIFLHNCAMAHINHRANPEVTHQEYYGDFQDPALTWRLVNAFETFEKICLGLGLALNLAGVKLPRSLVLLVLFVVNFIMSLPQAVRIEPDKPYGIDYIAYLQ